MTKKPAFKKGQTVWFYDLDKLYFGRVIYAYRGAYVVQTPSFLGVRNWNELWETK